MSPTSEQLDNNTTSDVMNGDDIVYDVVVVGGGVVGLAVLRQATLLGYRACCVEREDALLHWASGSNSGIICTGIDAPIGSLERALIRESIAQVRIHCRQFQIPVRDCGSLICQWPWDETNNSQEEQEQHLSQQDNNGNKDHLADVVVDKLDQVLEECHSAGDMQAGRLTPEDVQNLEPSLNQTCMGAVYVPGEMVVDPWMYAISFATHARENGAHIFTRFEVDLESSTLDAETGIWKLKRKTADNSITTSGHDTNHDSHAPPTTSTIPLVIRARAVVNATGAWSDVVEQRLTGSASFHVQPRRGQYRMFADTPGLCHLTNPIQPVPTARTKGIFVFSTLYNHIVVGPTAEDQMSRDDRSPDEEVRDKLTKTAKKLLPKLNTSISVGEYVGIRPGLVQQRDYQIQLNVAKRWVACAGIRSTGLTASLGIGRHVVYLLQQGVLPPPPHRHHHADIRTTPLPPLRELVYDFHRHNGHVEIGGHFYRVTHPITIHGWKLRTGLAGASTSSSSNTPSPASSPARWSLSR